MPCDTFHSNLNLPDEQGRTAGAVLKIALFGAKQKCESFSYSASRLPMFMAVSIRKQKVHESVEWLVGVVHDKKDWKMSNVSTLHEKQTTRNYCHFFVMPSPMEREKILQCLLSNYDF